MGEATDANARFDALWEEIGKKRATIGDEEDGVEIRLDVDLSPLALLKRMQALSERGHADGLLGGKAHAAFHDALEGWEQALSDAAPKKLRERWSKLLGRGH